MNNCWLCGRPIADPPEIIGHYIAGRHQVAHRRCWQVLGELELDLRPDSVGQVLPHDLGSGPV